MKYFALPIALILCAGSAYATLIKVSPSATIISKELSTNEAKEFQAAYKQRDMPWQLTQHLIDKMQAQPMSLNDLKPYSTEKFIKQLGSLKLVLSTFQHEIRELGDAATLGVNKRPQDYMLIQTKPEHVRIFVNDRVKKNGIYYRFQFAYAADAPYKDWKLIGLNYTIKKQ